MSSAVSGAAIEVLEASVRWLPVFTAALLTTWLMRRAPAAHRHVAWLVSVVALASMPVLNAVLPAHRIDFGGRADFRWQDVGEAEAGLRVDRTGESLTTSSSAFRPVAGPASSSGGASGGDPSDASSMGVRAWLDPIGWLWVVVTLTLLLREANALRRASRVAAAACAALDAVQTPLPPGGRVLDVRTAAVDVPLACGLMRPTILLPRAWRTWPAGWVDAALLHESVHVQRRDVLTQFVVRMICCVFWFHPGVWIALRRLQCEAEQAADEAVVDAGFDRHRYAEALLGLAHACGRRHAAAVPMTAKHPLAARLLRIVDAPSAARRERGLWPAVSLLALLAIVAAVPARERMSREWLHRSATEDGSVIWRAACPLGAPSESCARLNDAAVQSLRAGGGGFVAIADVRTGQLRHYLFLDATGTALPVPAVPPGALTMLPLAALWWETGMGDRPQPCPAVINLAGAGAFANGNGLDTGVVRAPRDVLRLRCATGAVAMGWYLTEEIGTAALAAAFARLGFGRDAAPFWAPPRFSPAPASPATGAGYDERSTWILAGSEHGTVRTSPLHLVRFLQAAANRGVARQMVPPGEPPDPRSRSLFSGETAGRLLHALLEAGSNQDQAGRLLGLASGIVDGLQHPQAELFGGIALDSAGAPDLAIVVWLERRTDSEAHASPADVAHRLLQAISR